MSGLTWWETKTKRQGIEKQCWFWGIRVSFETIVAEADLGEGPVPPLPHFGKNRDQFFKITSLLDTRIWMVPPIERLICKVSPFQNFWIRPWVDININNKRETVLLCFYFAHCERKLRDSVKFQLETFSLFFQPRPVACSYIVLNFQPIWALFS